jgi:hypothetical protein
MPRQVLNGVTNYYGPRTSFEGAAGTDGRVGNERVYTMFIGGQDLTAATLTLPAGFTSTGNTTVEVQQAFNLGGTTPVINIGVSGSEGTNRVAQISEAQAEAVGTYSIAPAGTLAINTPLAAAATIAVALGGTTPTNAGVGRMKVTFRGIVI